MTYQKKFSDEKVMRFMALPTLSTGPSTYHDQKFQWMSRYGIDGCYSFSYGHSVREAIENMMLAFDMEPDLGGIKE